MSITHEREGGRGIVVLGVEGRGEEEEEKEEEGEEEEEEKEEEEEEEEDYAKEVKAEEM
jgi:hypothetical protein